MNLAMTLELYAGGPGSGCRGPNCGRPSSAENKVLGLWKSVSETEIEEKEIRGHRTLSRAAIEAFPANKDKKFVGVGEGKVDKTLVKALREVYKETQDYYAARGIKEVTLYRGSEDEQKQRQALESWSSSKKLAQQYGDTQKVTVPVSAVLMSYESTKNWKSEHKFEKEFVVIGGALPKSFEQIAKAREPDYEGWRSYPRSVYNFKVEGKYLFQSKLGEQIARKTDSLLEKYGRETDQSKRQSVLKEVKQLYDSIPSLVKRYNQSKRTK